MRAWYVEVGQQIAILKCIVSIAQVRLLCSEQQDAHHVVRIGYDALLHQMVRAFEGSGRGRIAISFLVVRFRGLFQHRVANVDCKEDRIFDSLVTLYMVSLGSAMLFSGVQSRQSPPLHPLPLRDGYLGYNQPLWCVRLFAASGER